MKVKREKIFPFIPEKVSPIMGLKQQGKRVMEEENAQLGSLDEGEAPIQEAKKERSSKKFLLRILVLSLALILGFAGGLYISAGQQGALAWLGVGGGTAAEGAAVQTRIPDETAGLFKIPVVIANVSRTTEGGRKINRYLKVGVTLVHLPEAAALIQQREDYVVDAYQAYLRQVTPEEVEGSLGLMRLKAELLRRARAVVGDAEVRDVLVTELLIQ